MKLCVLAQIIHIYFHTVCVTQFARLSLPLDPPRFKANKQLQDYKLLACQSVGFSLFQSFCIAIYVYTQVRISTNFRTYFILTILGHTLKMPV